MTEEKKRVGLFWPMHQSGVLSGGSGYDDKGYPPRADAFVFEPHKNSDELRLWLADERVRDLIRITHFDPKADEMENAANFDQSQHVYVRLGALPDDIRSDIHAIMEKRLIEKRAEREKPEVEAALAALPQVDVREQLRKQRESLAEQARREQAEAEAFWNALPKTPVEGTNEIDFAWDLPKEHVLKAVLPKAPIV